MKSGVYVSSAKVGNGVHIEICDGKQYYCLTSEPQMASTIWTEEVDTVKYAWRKVQIELTYVEVQKLNEYAYKLVENRLNKQSEIYDLKEQLKTLSEKIQKLEKE